MISKDGFTAISVVVEVAVFFSQDAIAVIIKIHSNKNGSGLILINFIKAGTDMFIEVHLKLAI